MLKQIQNLRSPRRLSLAEKILFSHGRVVDRGSYVKCIPDHVAMQAKTKVSASVHCDHLIAAQLGAEQDLSISLRENAEVFDFLESVSAKVGLDFWKPGSGIIHQIVLENYARPGMLMLGTDSHTPNAGGLGAMAIGVGGADAVDALAGVGWEVKAPKILGVKLTGKLSGWASPKDVILKLAGILTVQGATNHVIEYFGPGVESLSCTGQATICNMGAELGATTSLFPFTPSMASYLRATRREQQARESEAAAFFLKADEGVEYDKYVEIDLSTLEPFINGPFSPDLAWPLSNFKNTISEKQWPRTLSAALIGSCTNSSYEDMSKSASIASQATKAGLKIKSQFLVTPGSEQIRATMERDGYTDILTNAGAKVLANACGPCIGQWKRDKAESVESNAILTSFNRNFAGRNDGSSKTMNFLASPEIVTAMAFSGSMAFNPMTDSIDTPNGPFKFTPPESIELPPSGFDVGEAAYNCPVKVHDPSIIVNILPSSNRLQVLDPFESWNGKEFVDLPVLIKVKGKCTTDHISAAGPWLKKDTIPNAAFEYHRLSIPWVIIADENYGEGSAREHAAMQPRYLGCKLIIGKSFARIHETNLKKQGILPLTFENPSDYELVHSDSVVSTEGLENLAPGSKVFVYLRRASCGTDRFVKVPLLHTLSADQIAWFKAGSALNLIAQTI